MSDKLNKVLIDKLIENEKLEEMANIQPRTTKLHGVLYSTCNGANEGYPHGPRVKIKTKNAGRFPIILKPSVKPVTADGLYKNLQNEDKLIVDEAVDYVKAHQKELLAHWDGIIGDEQLRKVLTKEFTLEQAIADAKENGLE